MASHLVLRAEEQRPKFWHVRSRLARTAETSAEPDSPHRDPER